FRQRRACRLPKAARRAPASWSPPDVGRQTTLSRLRPHAVCPNVAKTFHRRGTQCAHCSPPFSSRFPPSPKSPPPPPPHPPRKRPRRPLLHRLLLQSRKRPRRLHRATPARTSTRRSRSSSRSRIPTAPARPESKRGTPCAQPRP